MAPCCPECFLGALAHGQITSAIWRATGTGTCYAAAHRWAPRTDPDRHSRAGAVCAAARTGAERTGAAHTAAARIAVGHTAAAHIAAERIAAAHTAAGRNTDCHRPAGSSRSAGRIAAGHTAEGPAVP